MLTRMTDQDWDSVVQVFRAVRSRRGSKGRNDRRFLEAVHYFTLHNITWRALPAECGNWNSVWKVTPMGCRLCWSGPVALWRFDLHARLEPCRPDLGAARRRACWL